MESERARTRAWVLHPDLKSDPDRREAAPALDEAVALAAALPDLDVIGSTVVPLPKAQAGLLFGTGKIAELKEVFSEAEIELVLIDDFYGQALDRIGETPNLEEHWLEEPLLITRG